MLSMCRSLGMRRRGFIRRSCATGYACPRILRSPASGFESLSFLRIAGSSALGFSVVFLAFLVDSLRFTRGSHHVLVLSLRSFNIEDTLLLSGEKPLDALFDVLRPHVGAASNDWLECVYLGCIFGIGQEPRAYGVEE